MALSDSNNKTYSIRQRHQIMTVNMLQNWNHRYYNYYNVIKYVGFKPIIYVINLDTASSSKIFREFDYMFLSNAC